MPGPDPNDRTLSASRGVRDETAPLDQTSEGPRPAAPVSFPFLAAAQQPDEVGRLGRYRVLAALGHGGMGVVFRAEDPVLKRNVALKVMLPHIAANPHAKARFVREARAQAAVEHDHIIPIFDIYEAHDPPFLAMPLLKGMTLAAALKANPRPPLAAVVRIGREIAEGLDAAHETGLIHRDIKPANVWLEGNRLRVRILDFGLARAAAETDPAATGEEPLTAEGAVVGTPMYMSPEQARGEPLDPRTDLFSLGVVLYQMATGRLPFEGKSTAAVLLAVVSHHPTGLAEVDPPLPPALNALVTRLLAKDTAGRPATAAEVATELQQIEFGLTAAAAVQVVPLDSIPGAPAAANPWEDIEATEPVMVASGSQAVEAVAPRARKPGGSKLALAAGVLGLLLVVGLAGVMYKAMTRPGPAVAEDEPPPPPKPKDPPATKPPIKGAPPPPPATMTAAERKALEWVLSVGGKVRVRAVGGDQTVGPSGKLPVTRFTVRDVDLSGVVSLDVAALENLRAVPPVSRSLVLRDTGLADAGLEKIATLPGLTGVESLSLIGTRVTNAGLAAVKAFPRLTYLYLNGTQVTGAGLAHLRGLKLEAIDLHGCNVDAAGLAHLADMTTLKRVWLMYTPPGDAGIQKLAGLTELDYLHPGTVTDEAIDTILGFRKLTSLHLTGSKLTGVGLRRLTAMSGLSVLALGETRVSDADLPVLKEFPELRMVGLENNTARITDAGLVHLAACPGLTSINLTNTKVTEPGVKKLAAALPLCKIVWDGGTIEPQPVVEVLRPAVASLLKGGVRVRIPDGPDRQQALTSADTLKDADRIHDVIITITPNRNPLADPAVRDALRAFPAAGWAAAGGFSVSGPVTPAEVRDLVGCPGLRAAAVWGVHHIDLRDDDLAPLADLPAVVRWFNFSNCPNLMGSVLKSLAGRPNLLGLMLTDAKLSSAELAALRGSPLTQLQVQNNPGIDDEAVPHLAACPGLTSINLTNTKVTEAGVKKLAAALPLCKITWDGGVIGPAEPPKK